MRCKGVADIMVQRGWKIIWLLDAEAARYFEDLRLPGSLASIPSTTSASAGTSLPALFPDLDLSTAIIVLDGYAFTPACIASYAALPAKLVVFDDGLLHGNLDADLVINAAMQAEAEEYQKRGVKRALTGLEYAPVRLDFALQEQLPLHCRSRLLVMFGGADPLGLTLQCINAMIAHGWPVDVPVDIVTGAAFPDADRIGTLLEGSALPMRHWHNTDRIPALMADARLALAAAGSTALELAVMRVPSILLVVADNQQNTATQLARLRWFDVLDARNALDWPALLELCLERWRAAGSGGDELQSSFGCDGRGLPRIAEAIESL